MAPCILGKFLGVVCHCFPPRLDVPIFAARCLHVRSDAKGGTMGEKGCPVILPTWRLYSLLHAANLRHGTDGFTSPPKEGVRIFSPLKIRGLRPGLNPRTWVLKASRLTLDHRSRLFSFYTKKNHFQLCSVAPSLSAALQKWVGNVTLDMKLTRRPRK